MGSHIAIGAASPIKVTADTQQLVMAQKNISISRYYVMIIIISKFDINKSQITIKVRIMTIVLKLN